MQISNRLAGYSLGDADILRRAMGKKKAEEMASQRERFLEGAKKKGFAQKKVEKVFDLMEKFAGYGFPKAHSAAFGLLAYQSAFLQVHYAPEFLAALLNEQPMGFYPPDALVGEARRRGVAVAPPDAMTVCV